MDVNKIINKYYNNQSDNYQILINHSQLVTQKALMIADKNKHLNPDIDFIKEAAMIHDIGIFLTKAPSIKCFGSLPYICHGYLGRQILQREGFLKHGLVCERHIGLGLSAQEIKAKKIMIVNRDMLPISVEEQIICLADKFFSKSKRNQESIKDIEKELEKHGWGHKQRFQELVLKFNLE